MHITELLLTWERRSDLLPYINSTTLSVPLMQQLQYQLAEHIRVFADDLYPALVASSPSTHTPKDA